MSRDALILCIVGVVILCLAPILAKMQHYWFNHGPFSFFHIHSLPDSSPLIIAYGCIGLLLLLFGVAISLPHDVVTAVAPFLGICVLPLVAGAAVSLCIWRLGGLFGDD